MVDRPVNDRFSEIDWNAPWFTAVAENGRLLNGATSWRRALNDKATRSGVCTANGLPVRFIRPEAAGPTPYEVHIARTGEVPTRERLHDVFNALVWLTLPRTKARLNALQAHVIETHGVGARRGAVRDAATLIDENGVLLVTRRPGLVDALHRRDWSALFVIERSAWADEVRAIVFGHALMEKLVLPYKGICAHAYPLMLDASAPLADIDAAAAQALDGSLTPRSLLPLPVLGIPGWMPNDDPAFYADERVFRPQAARRAVMTSARVA